MRAESVAERCAESASGSNSSQVRTFSYSTNPHPVRLIPLDVTPTLYHYLSPGLDSVSAAKVVSVLHALAHDTDNPTAVIATIHQPSSQIYRIFDRVVLLAGGRSLYEGLGGFAPAEYFATQGSPCAPGYNVADHLLDIAHAPPRGADSSSFSNSKEAAGTVASAAVHERGSALKKLARPTSAAAFLTQLEVLAGREWKVLRRFVQGLPTHIISLRLLICWTFCLSRDRTFFLAHMVISVCLGVFCGGLYWKTGINIAGFQSRVGSLFFLVRFVFLRII
jgi:hypothetical protein